MPGATGCRVPAVVAAEYKGELLVPWNDGDTFRRFQEILRDTPIRGVHDLLEDLGSLVGAIHIILAVEATAVRVASRASVATIRIRFNIFYPPPSLNSLTETRCQSIDSRTRFCSPRCRSSAQVNATVSCHFFPKLRIKRVIHSVIVDTGNKRFCAIRNTSNFADRAANRRYRCRRTPEGSESP